MWSGGDGDKQKGKGRCRLLCSLQHVSAKDTLSLCMVTCSGLLDVVTHLLTDTLNMRIVERGRGGALGTLHGAACRGEGQSRGGLG